MADHERATNSNKPKCSAGKVFRLYMEKLMEAIQSADIPMVAVKLYSKEIISENTRDKVFLPILTKLEKNRILLTAVEDAIKTQPQMLVTLLDILNEFKPADLIAQEMCQQLDHSVPLEMYCETCHQLFCQYCSITDHKAHQYGLVADVFPKHKKELERELTAVKQQLPVLTTAQQAMEDRLDQISVQGKEVEQQIHTATQQAMERLQESEKKTIKMVRSEMQRKYNTVYRQKEEVTSKRRCLVDFQTFVEEEVMAASQQQVLTVKHEKMDHVQSVRSEITSSNLQPVEEASIKFIPSQDLLSRCSELGDVNIFHDIAAKTRPSRIGIEIAMAHKTTSFELTGSSFSSFDALSCQLTAPGSSDPVECTITPTQSGGCSISYTPAVRGPHQMRITVGGIDIPNSPFTIHVYPSPEMRGEQIGVITGVTDPQHLAVSKSGEVVVSEGNNHITVFNKDGSKQRTFGSTGSDKGQFQSPRGIALTHDNHLLVVDEGNHRVQMFTLEGKFVKSVGQKGKGRLQFSSPQGITVHHSSHQVFIADTGNNRIQVLNDDLTYSHKFIRSVAGQFNTPFDVACDSHGKVYVVDTLNGCVQVLTSSGQFITTLVAPSSLLPTSIAIDPIMDTVYISNGYKVSVFNNKSQLIKRFESKDSTKSQFIAEPELYVAGLAVDYTGNLLHALPHQEAVAIY